MKKTITTIALMISVQSFASEHKLSNGEAVHIDDLITNESTFVTCKSTEPKCILRGKEYGIRYEGQPLSDVTLIETHSYNSAIEKLTELREQGFCN